MLLIKIPLPDPSEVLLSVVVGFDKVLQQTPLLLTIAPPSSVILPPLCPDTEVIIDIDVVVIFGRLAVAVVEKETLSPYSVPNEFVAYALTKYVAFAINPVILLVKLLLPEPLIVLLFAIVGLIEVPQHIPFSVIADPPSLVISPPLSAVDAVMEVT